MRMGLAILAASLALWGWRAYDYAAIGGYAPLGVFLLAASMLLVCAYDGGRDWLWAVRGWGAFLVITGLARAGLGIALQFDPGVAPYAYDAQTALYHASTVFHLAAGAWLVWRPPAIKSLVNLRKGVP